MNTEHIELHPIVLVVNAGGAFVPEIKISYSPGSAQKSIAPVDALKGFDLGVNPVSLL